MIEPKKMAIPTHSSEEPMNLIGETNWERFYREFRKPGYLPGYEIQQRLGGGVFGIVFKAKKESIGKAYAIKFLRVEDPAVRTQVLNELETVSLFAQVDHPNLVTIEDKGVVDGIPYIIMGYAGDETLKSRLQEGSMDQAEAMRVMKQVLLGVKALHDHGLAHFDLKPANLFIHGDIVRVGDYGLSKLIRESCSSLSFGRGTPYYMAPEMLRRKGDQRSDIYSLGVIFFECLTGKVPFEGENEWEVLKAHEERPVVFPAEVPKSLRDILRRMLIKDPELRVQDLGEVLESLEGGADSRAKEGTTVPPLPNSTTQGFPPHPPSIPIPWFQGQEPPSFPPRKCIKGKPMALFMIGLIVAGFILFMERPVMKRFLGPALLFGIGLTVSYLIHRRNAKRRSLPQTGKESSALASGSNRMALLLFFLLGAFVFIGVGGFLFLSLGRSSFSAARLRVERERAMETAQPIFQPPWSPPSEIPPTEIKIGGDEKTVESHK